MCKNISCLGFLDCLTGLIPRQGEDGKLTDQVHKYSRVPPSAANISSWISANSHRLLISCRPQHTVWSKWWLETLESCHVTFKHITHSQYNVLQLGPNRQIAEIFSYHFHPAETLAYDADEWEERFGDVCRALGDASNSETTSSSTTTTLPNGDGAEWDGSSWCPALQFLFAAPSCLVFAPFFSHRAECRCSAGFHFDWYKMNEIVHYSIDSYPWYVFKWISRILWFLIVDIHWIFRSSFSCLSSSLRTAVKSEDFETPLYSQTRWQLPSGRNTRIHCRTCALVQSCSV